MWSLDWNWLAFTGSEQRDYLERMLTCSVASLAPGETAHGLLLSRTGRTLGTSRGAIHIQLADIGDLRPIQKLSHHRRNLGRVAINGLLSAKHQAQFGFFCSRSQHPSNTQRIRTSKGRIIQTDCTVRAPRKSILDALLAGRFANSKNDHFRCLSGLFKLKGRLQGELIVRIDFPLDLIGHNTRTFGIDLDAGVRSRNLF